MKFKQLLECERRSLEKLKNYQFPNHYKKLGILIFVIAFVSLFINAFTIHNLLLREIIKYVLLVSLLIISISKDKIEDEYIKSLRMQSYAFAFIFGVVFTLVQPLARLLFELLSNTNQAIIKDTGDFELLWILLFVQIFYFEFLKRIN